MAPKISLMLFLLALACAGCRSIGWDSEEGLVMQFRKERDETSDTLRHLQNEQYEKKYRK